LKSLKALGGVLKIKYFVERKKYHAVGHNSLRNGRTTLSMQYMYAVYRYYIL
jgi:hypothetical protein